MVIQPSQYNSFLGGEVSPLLWHRADMSQFGKWFANAENIRFTTMGAFENRPGFTRVGPVLESALKPLVKLIPFVFNNEEVFEIEFITGKFRVRKHGEVVVREDGSEVVYDSPIKIESLQQLKYAQSGDIIFIASGTSPVMELRRLKTDGTEWELVEFSGKVYPLFDENENEDDVVSIVSPEGNLALYKVLDFGDKYYSDKKYRVMIVIYKNGEEYGSVPTSGSTEDIATQINGNSYLNPYIDAVKISDTSIKINKKEYIEDVTFGYTIEYAVISTSSIQKPIVGVLKNFEFAIPENHRISGLYINCKLQSNRNSFDFERSLGDRYNGFYPTTGLNSFKEKMAQEGLELTDLSFFYKEHVLYIKFTVVSYKYPNNETIYNVIEPKIQLFFLTHQEELNKIELTKKFISPDNYLLRKGNIEIGDIGDMFAIKRNIKTGEVIKTQGSGVFESDALYSMGKWRFYTSGNWKGTIRLEYSKDKGNTWNMFRTAVSSSTSDPGIFNENTSGTIETDDVIQIKLIANVTEGTVNINFYTDSFEIFSYYKIVDIFDPRTYIVSCVKNNMGEVEDTFHWRKSAFSKKMGYPEAIGFYQNRLFFTKGYELWGSKINNFWDFYEPIELKKDDPINMSILTYKVNTIKNILTTKSFFIFTTGGEFGVSSQGALSQDDKFLKQFSSHGSNSCTPLIVGNIVLFVDATGNTVRAFQYSFEADNYEATDISLFIEQKLKDKQIITAEYIGSTKECLFLDADGIIWVFKYMPEQNIMSWSHWKHGQYKITNLCVTPNGAYDELYIVVDAPDGKFIERLDSSVYSDSVEIYEFEEEVEEIQTQLVEGQIVNVDDGINNKYKAAVGEFGKVKLRSPSKNVKIGLSYTSVGTLLTPTIQLQNQTYTTYNKMKPFKVYFRYRDSFGFKIGVEEEEKMDITFQDAPVSIEEATSLTTGKKSVLIPSRYDGSGRVSFVQDEPYPMCIENAYLEVDYGGK